MGVEALIPMLSILVPSGDGREVGARRKIKLELKAESKKKEIMESEFETERADFAIGIPIVPGKSTEVMSNSDTRRIRQYW